MNPFSEIVFQNEYGIFAVRFEGAVEADNHNGIVTELKHRYKCDVSKIYYIQINDKEISSVIRVNTEEESFLFSFSTISSKQNPVEITTDKVVSIFVDDYTKSLSSSKTRSFFKRELVAQLNLLKGKSNVFYGAGYGGSVIFENAETKKRKKETFDFCISDNERIKNLYEGIQSDVVLYCHQEGIAFWHAGVNETNQVTNHILSSQIACFNHLFMVRDDKNAVLSIANAATGRKFEEVLAIPYDNGEHYISFEVVSNKDYLREDPDNLGLSRGSMCTSIDALIIAKDKDGTYLLPIEWKYTESYDDADKSLEYKKGETRLKRYEDLRCMYFNTNIQRSLFYIEPFYQLMRQTMWAEEVIKNQDIPLVKDYIHIHVVPSDNTDLVNKKYPYSTSSNMVGTWRSCLKTPDKYICIDPKYLVEAIEKSDNNGKYDNLINYLRKRYNYKLASC